VERPPWNHNLYYHALLLAAVPPGAQRALDVGCGDGLLTRELRRLVPQVTGIDLDAPSLERARGHTLDDGIEYVHGDFLTYPFEPEAFDAILSVAALHHMDAAAALARMRSLLRPGGVLSVLGLARDGPADLPLALVAAVAHRLYRLRRGYLEQASPTIWPPPETYSGMRRIARAALPGARYRRHLFWRYSLVWTKPADRSGPP
jgi:SAM-dependent methyltransferase